MKPLSCLPVVHLDAATALARGQQHGEQLRVWIQDMAAIRLQLLRKECDFRSDQDVFDLAEVHVPLLQAFDTQLFEECMGIAQGSNTTLQQIVIVNHYTDLRDLRRRRVCQGTSAATHKRDPGGCSTIYVPRQQGALLGQTWDIHVSALPYVALLHVKWQPIADTLPSEAFLITVAGCVGMTGMNHHGVAVCINNLHSVTAQKGVLWPAVVRKALQYSTAKQAMEVILQCQVGSGRHYAVADPHHIQAAEVHCTAKVLLPTHHQKPYWHTNHCLNEEMAKHHFIPPHSSTRHRLSTLHNLLSQQPPESLTEMLACLQQVVIVPKQEVHTRVHNSATCAALVMDLQQKQLHACAWAPSPQAALKQISMCDRVGPS
ncbi:MAG: C45 family peptidase [Myxococcota bacterium]